MKRTAHGIPCRSEQSNLVFKPNNLTLMYDKGLYIVHKILKNVFMILFVIISTNCMNIWNVLKFVENLMFDN